MSETSLSSERHDEEFVLVSVTSRVAGKFKILKNVFIRINNQQWRIWENQDKDLDEINRDKPNMLYDRCTYVEE